MTGAHPSLDVTREKLIEAAGEVFAEVGFHNATVREICALAGTNIAAVNYYFGEKLGLYSEVLKSSILAQQADELVSNGFSDRCSMYCSITNTVHLIWPTKSARKPLR